MREEYNVLSEFDGMSCGQIALERAGKNITNYFASEIEKKPIELALKNFPLTKNLGDVTKINIKDLPKIHLFIGGSPCQGFSFAGKGLNFDDPRSRLFFEFAADLRYIQEFINQDVEFMLENVRMKKEYQDVITRFLGVSPVMINSKLVSAQNRERMYWTNIKLVNMPEDKNILIKDILEIDQSKFRYLSEKATLRAKYNPRSRIINLGKDKFPTLLHNQGKQSTDSICILLDNGLVRWPTRKESERMQTVPEGYTDGVGECMAQSILGNGWTVDVIAHIFKHLA